MVQVPFFWRWKTGPGTHCLRMRWITSTRGEKGVCDHGCFSSELRRGWNTVLLYFHLKSPGEVVKMYWRQFLLWRLKLAAAIIHSRGMVWIISQSFHNHFNHGLCQSFVIDVLVCIDVVVWLMLRLLDWCVVWLIFVIDVLKYPNYHDRFLVIGAHAQTVCTRHRPDLKEKLGPGNEFKANGPVARPIATLKYKCIRVCIILLPPSL